MVNTNKDLVRDASHTIAATTAGPASQINDASERGEHNTALDRIKAAIDREPDDALAVEAVADIIMSDPLAAMLEIMDAEAATDRETAIWEGVMVEFAKRERIKTSPFQYTGNRPPKLLRKPWLDFGRNWPYCFARTAGGSWIPLGRQYKPLGAEQFGGGSFKYNEFAHTAWRFIDDPTTFGEDVWTRVTGDRLWLYSDDPASRRDYFARVGRLVALTDDPVEYARLLTWHNGQPPDAADAAMAA
jgi:hypothetical protein